MSKHKHASCGAKNCYLCSNDVQKLSRNPSDCSSNICCIGSLLSEPPSSTNLVFSPIMTEPQQTTSTTGASPQHLRSDSEVQYTASSPSPSLLRSPSFTGPSVPPVASVLQHGRSSVAEDHLSNHTGIGVSPLNALGKLKVTSTPLPSAGGSPVSNRRQHLAPLSSPVASPSTFISKSSSHSLLPPPRGLLERPDSLNSIATVAAPSRRPPLSPSVSASAAASGSQPRLGGAPMGSALKGRPAATGAPINLVEALDAECDAVLGGGVAAILAKHNYHTSSSRPNSAKGRSEIGNRGEST